MLYFANWKITLICAVCALGVLLSLPNLFSPSLLAQLPSFLPHKPFLAGETVSVRVMLGEGAAARPASFAFSNRLDFDAVIMASSPPRELEGYTTEEQACDYPAGSYELALQSAALILVMP